MQNQTKEFYGHFSNNTNDTIDSNDQHESYDFEDCFAPEYKNLMINLKNNDRLYSLANTVEEKVELSSNSIRNWNEHLKFERKHIHKVNKNIH